MEPFTTITHTFLYSHHLMDASWTSGVRYLAQACFDKMTLLSHSRQHPTWGRVPPPSSLRALKITLTSPVASERFRVKWSHTLLESLHPNSAFSNRTHRCNYIRSTWALITGQREHTQSAFLSALQAFVFPTFALTEHHFSCNTQLCCFESVLCVVFSLLVKSATKPIHVCDCSPSLSCKQADS